MRYTLLGLALLASPAVAQLPLYPMPTPPPVVPQTILPFTIDPLVIYQPYAVPTYSTPQYIYRTYEGTTLPQLTPDYALVPTPNGTVVYPTYPNTSMYDITKPLFIIK